MAESLDLGLTVARFGPIYVPKISSVDFTSTRCCKLRDCCKLSLYTISSKTNEPNLRKWQKNPLVLDPSLAHLGQIRGTNFFFKYLSPSVTRFHGHLLLCTISENTNGPIFC